MAHFILRQPEQDPAEIQAGLNTNEHCLDSISSQAHQHMATSDVSLDYNVAPHYAIHPEQTR